MQARCTVMRSPQSTTPPPKLFAGLSIIESFLQVIASIVRVFLFVGKWCEINGEARSELGLLLTCWQMLCVNDTFKVSKC